MASKLIEMVAKRHSECFACDDGIKPGDVILYEGPSLARHKDCPIDVVGARDIDDGGDWGLFAELFGDR